MSPDKVNLNDNEGSSSRVRLDAVSSTTLPPQNQTSPVNSLKQQHSYDVDSEVLKRLESTTDPENVFSYDLAGPGSIKEKAEVIWKSCVYIVGFLMFLGIGKFLDAILFKTDTHSVLSISSFILAAVWLAIYVPYIRYKLRRNVVREQQPQTKTIPEDDEDV